MSDVQTTQSDPWAAFPVDQDQPSQGKGTVTLVGMGSDDPWDSYPKADQVSSADTAIDVAKSAPIGVAKGAISVAGIGGDLQNAAQAGADKFLPKPEGGDPVSLDYARKYGSRGDLGPSFPLPSSEQIQSLIEKVTGPFYKPKTDLGKTAETVGEFLPASVVGPGGVARKVILGGVVPGVAAAGAEHAAEGTILEPWAKPVIGATTALATHTLAGPGIAENAIRQQLPAYITDAHIQRAQAVMDAGRARGIDLTWPEALSQVSGRPVLSDMMRIVESAPTSRETMQTFHGDRQGQVDRAVRDELGNIAPQSANPSMLGPQASEAATEGLNTVRGAINQASDPFYRRSSTILLTQQEMDRVRQIPGFREAADAVRRDVQLNRHVAGLPEDSVGFLNEVKKYLDQQSTNATHPMQANASVQRAAGYSQDATGVRDAASNATLGAPNYDYAIALQLQQQNRQRYLEPLLQGPLGKIADTPQTSKAIEALFPTNPIAGGEHEISTAVGAIAARRPLVAAQLVRAHAEGIFNEAAQNLQSGANQFGGAKFAARIAGNPQQRANLQAAVEALPNGQARWQGFDNLLAVLEATGTRQQKGSLTAFNTNELKGMSSGGAISEATKTGLSPGKWWSIVNDKVSQWQLGRNLDQLANILTDPTSGQLLSRISRIPPQSSEAGALAARIILQNDVSLTAERKAQANRQRQ